jgi:proteasome accessory factor A
MTDVYRPFVMGSETEYGLAGRKDGQGMDPDEVYDLLSTALQRQRACVPDEADYSGLFLEHGGRIYLDYGSHPEHATPECLTPRQVACYDKAGEHLLALAARGAEADCPGLRVRLVKNNLDPLFPDQVSYGSHESYTCWASGAVAAPQLMAHLVSRVLYAGAGGLSAHPAGVGFELSQRARHMMETVGDDTTGDRAIFSCRVRRDYDQSGGWTRIHLIGKDSQRAPLGIYLTFATTGLLIERINRGQKVGVGLEFADPVEALRAFSRDPWLRARAALADGRKLTALEVQALYLEECERAVQHGGLPGWAPEALGHWRQTLADLQRDPLRLADRLDPYCKLLIYEHELLRAGLDWHDLRQALATLAELRARWTDEVISAVLAESPGGLSAEQRADFDNAVAQARAREPGRLERLRFAVRLQALDVHYHELGGLYDRLRQAGRLRDVVLEPGDVERASREPPPGGRAALRGGWIRGHREAGWRADWQYVWQPESGQCLDLRDPFAGEQRLAQLPAVKPGEAYRVYVPDLLAAPAAR